MDSGAFSAWRLGAKIDIDEYIAFIKRNMDIIEVYANLDVIGSPEGTLENQKYMEKHGLRPLPVFHHNEPEKFLHYYLDKYDYLALGGLAKAVRKGAIIRWLDYVWSTYLVDTKGKPKIRVHGFGQTSIDYIMRYPWYSIDSTSWLLPGVYGKIFVPYSTAGGYDFHRPPRIVQISDDAPGSSKSNSGHFNSMSAEGQAYIQTWVASVGVDFSEAKKNHIARASVNIEFFKAIALNFTDTMTVVRKGFIK